MLGAESTSLGQAAVAVVPALTRPSAGSGSFLELAPRGCRSAENAPLSGCKERCVSFRDHPTVAKPYKNSIFKR